MAKIQLWTGTLPRPIPRHPLEGVVQGLRQQVLQLRVTLPGTSDTRLT